MKRGGGKRKGSAFENLMARTLSRWLVPGDSTQLIPSRLSGGWKDAEWRQAGDLAPNGPAGEEFRKRFLVEVKHQKKDLLWLLYTQSPRANIQGWWEKLRTEARKIDKVPILIVRQNARPILVVLPQYLARHIHKTAGGTMLEYGAVYTGKTINCGIITLESFLALTPKKLYDLLST